MLFVMPLIASTMLDLGTAVPNFSLPDVTTGATVSLSDVKGDKGVLVMFICSHCPFVVHVQGQLAQLGKDYAASGIGIVAICSNDETVSPTDSVEHLKAQAATQRFAFPYLRDESQEVARAYNAACTPDFFLYDSDGHLAYRGQLDGARPGNGVAVNGADLRAAMDAVAAGAPPAAQQTAAMGCSIKWRDD
jgi:peroxiredoxin